MADPTAVVFPLAGEIGALGAGQVRIGDVADGWTPLDREAFFVDRVQQTWEGFKRGDWPEARTGKQLIWRADESLATASLSGASANLASLLAVALHEANWIGRWRRSRLGAIWATGMLDPNGRLQRVDGVEHKVRHFCARVQHDRGAMIFVPSANSADVNAVRASGVELAVSTFRPRWRPPTRRRQPQIVLVKSADVAALVRWWLGAPGLLMPLLAVAAIGLAVALVPCLTNRPARLRVGLAGSPAPAIKQLLEEYDRDHPEVELSIELRSPGEYEQARGAFRDETYDVVMVDDPWLPAYREALYPLDDLIDLHQRLTAGLEHEFVGDMARWARPRTASGEESRQLALPLVGNVLMLLYNTRAWPQGPPPDFPLTASTLEPPANFTQPITFRWSERNSSVEVFLELLRAFGHPEDAGAGVDGPIYLDAVGVEAALRWMDELAHDGPTLRSEDVRGLLFERQAPAALGWPSWFVDPASAVLSPNVGVRRISAHPVLGIWFFGVRTTSSNPKLAAEVVLALTANLDAQVRLANLGLPPAHAGVEEKHLRDSGLRARLPAIQAALEIGLPRPRRTDWVVFERKLGESLRTAIRERRHTLDIDPAYFVVH